MESTLTAPTTTPKFTADNVRAGISFRLAGNPAVFNVTLIAGDCAFYRDGTPRSSRHLTKAAFAQMVRSGAITLAD